MHLVHKERTKLSAAWLSTLATALVAAGAFAPLAAWLYGLSALPAPLPVMFIAAIGCGAAGVALHFVGRAYLGRLRE